MFGNVYINPSKLLDMKLEAYKDGKKVLSRRIDTDLHDLLTKRYDSKECTVRNHWILLVN